MIKYPATEECGPGSNKEMSSILADQYVPSYMRPHAGGGGGSCVVSANKYSYPHGAQINFGDLTPYLTYDED